MTCEVMEAYEGEHLSHIRLYEFVHITKKGRMSVIEVSFSQGPQLVAWIKGVVKHHSS